MPVASSLILHKKIKIVLRKQQKIKIVRTRSVAVTSWPSALPLPPQCQSGHMARYVMLSVGYVGYANASRLRASYVSVSRQLRACWPFICWHCWLFVFDSQHSQQTRTGFLYSAKIRTCWHCWLCQRELKSIRRRRGVRAASAPHIQLFIHTV